MDPVDEYFESLRGALYATVGKHREAQAQEKVGYKIRTITLFLSVIFIPPLVGAAALVATLSPARLGAATFGQVYWACVVAWLGLGVIGLNIGERISRKLSRDKKKTSSLSRPQRSFAFAYAIAEELAKYRNNHFDEHLENANLYWRLLLDSLADTFRTEKRHPASFVPGRAPSSGDFDGFSFFRHTQLPNVTWFRLQDRTQQFASAFDTLPGLVTDRLREGKDIPALIGLAERLAEYLYFEIPDIRQQDKNPAEMEATLEAFVSSVSSLAEYRRQPVDKVEDHSSGQQLRARISSVFTADNVLTRVIAWYVFFELIVLFGAFIATRRLHDVKLDSTLASLLVGVAPVCAATLASLVKPKK